jgi:hypothetical protein
MRCASALLLVWALTMAGCVPPHVPPPPAPPADVDRSAALLKIYVDAAVTSGSAPAPLMTLTFLPTLEQAALAIVAGAGTAAGEARRRRVIAKLGAVDAVHYKPTLAALNVAPSLFAAIHAAMNVHAVESLVTREVIVYDLLEKILGPLHWCLSTYPITWVTDPDHTPTGTVWYAIHRTPARVAIATDPQNWSRCSIFFSQSYVVRPPPMPPTCSSSNPFQGAQPPTPGSAWSGTLFEHAVFWWGSWFKNYLNIGPRSVTPGSTTIRGYHYDLNASVCSKIIDEENGGFRTDEGDLVITPSPYDAHWSWVSASKAVRFSHRNDIDEQTLEAVTIGMLWMMGYEAVDMACCAL